MNYEQLTAVFMAFICQQTALSGATCNDDQISACRAAAVSGRLSDYRGSGRCGVKQYVQYTHLCTVSDYLPSIDHCCCQLNADSLLCCRYHQDWYHFRCMDSEDIIHIRNLNESWLRTWQFLVPAILCPLVVLVAVVVYCYVRPFNRGRLGHRITSSWTACCCALDPEGQKRQVTRSSRQVSADASRLPVRPTVAQLPAYSPPRSSPLPAEPSAPPLLTSSLDADVSMTSPAADCDATFICQCVRQADDTLPAVIGTPCRVHSFRSDVIWPTTRPLCRTCAARARACSVCSGDDVMPPSYESSQRLEASHVTS